MPTSKRKQSFNAKTESHPSLSTQYASSARTTADVEKAFLDFSKSYTASDLNEAEENSDKIQYFVMQIVDGKDETLTWLYQHKNYGLLLQWLFPSHTSQETFVPYKALMSARDIATVIHRLGKLTKKISKFSKNINISSVAINELINKLISTHPSAQAIANSILGLGYLAKAHLLKTQPIECEELLTQLMSVHPNAQNIANSILGLGYLAKANLLKEQPIECGKLLTQLMSVQPNAQAIANSILGLGYLANAGLLKNQPIECGKLLTQLMNVQPNAQAIANSILGLGYLAKASLLKEQPINCIELLTQLMDTQPTAQAIANSILGLGYLAKADLLKKQPIESEKLLTQLMSAQPNAQEIANSILGLGYLANTGLLKEQSIECVKLLTQLMNIQPAAQEIANSILGLGYLAKASLLKEQPIESGKLLTQLMSAQPTTQNIANSILGLGYLANAGLLKKLPIECVKLLIQLMSVQPTAQEITNSILGLGYLAMQLDLSNQDSSTLLKQMRTWVQSIRFNLDKFHLQQWMQLHFTYSYLHKKSPETKLRLTDNSEISVSELLNKLSEKLEQAKPISSKVHTRYFSNFKKMLQEAKLEDLYQVDSEVLLAGYFVDILIRDRQGTPLWIIEIDGEHHYDVAGKLRAQDAFRSASLKFLFGCEVKRIKVGQRMEKANLLLNDLVTLLQTNQAGITCATTNHMVSVIKSDQQKPVQLSASSLSGINAISLAPQIVLATTDDRWRTVGKRGTTRLMTDAELIRSEVNLASASHSTPPQQTTALQHERKTTTEISIVDIQQPAEAQATKSKKRKNRKKQNCAHVVFENNLTAHNRMIIKSLVATSVQTFLGFNLMQAVITEASQSQAIEIIVNQLTDAINEEQEKTISALLAKSFVSAHKKSCCTFWGREYRFELTEAAIKKQLQSVMILKKTL